MTALQGNLVRGNPPAAAVQLVDANQISKACKGVPACRFVCLSICQRSTGQGLSPGHGPQQSAAPRPRRGPAWGTTTPRWPSQSF